MFKGKMKKIISVIGVFVLMLSLVACGDKRTAEQKEEVESILSTAGRIEVFYGISPDKHGIKRKFDGIFYKKDEVFTVTMAENGGQKQGEFGAAEFNKLKDIISSLNPVANENFADEEEIAGKGEDHGFIVIHYLVEGQDEPSRSYFRVEDSKKLNAYVDELASKCN